MSAIEFGTGGWRGVVAREFTFANVAIVTQAVALYIKERRQGERGMIVGYDDRFRSRLFAERACEVLAGNGIGALLYTAAELTPAVADTIVISGLAGALLITADDDPEERNGLQFIPDYGGKATPAVAVAINSWVREVEALRQEVRVMPYQKAVRAGLVLAVQPKAQGCGVLSV